MNATPNLIRSLSAPGSNSRPAFRVICAWCQQELAAAPAPQALTGTSHGICPSCALQHFGLRLEAPDTVAAGAVTMPLMLEAWR